MQKAPAVAHQTNKDEAASLREAHAAAVKPEEEDEAKQRPNAQDWQTASISDVRMPGTASHNNVAVDQMASTVDSLGDTLGSEVGTSCLTAPLCTSHFASAHSNRRCSLARPNIRGLIVL